MKLPTKLTQSLKILNRSTTATIVVVSIIAAILLILIAVHTSGTMHDFVVNMAASVLMVVFTVLLVDSFRSMRAEQELKIPRSEAIRRLRIANMGLMMFVSAKNPLLRVEFIKDMMKDESTDKGPLTSAYASRLAKQTASEIIQDMSIQDINGSLRSSLKSSIKQVQHIEERYGFTFNSTRFRADLASLANALEGALDGLVVLDLPQADFMKILTSKTPTTYLASIQVFVGALLKTYATEYAAFIDRYGNP
jgi:hypothetical protein